MERHDWLRHSNNPVGIPAEWNPSWNLDHGSRLHFRVYDELPDLESGWQRHELFGHHAPVFPVARLASLHGLLHHQLLRGNHPVLPGAVPESVPNHFVCAREGRRSLNDYRLVSIQPVIHLFDSTGGCASDDDAQRYDVHLASQCLRSRLHHHLPSLHRD